MFSIIGDRSSWVVYLILSCSLQQPFLVLRFRHATENDIDFMEIFKECRRRQRSAVYADEVFFPPRTHRIRGLNRKGKRRFSIGGDNHELSYTVFLNMPTNSTEFHKKAVARTFRYSLDCVCVTLSKDVGDILTSLFFLKIVSNKTIAGSSA